MTIRSATAQDLDLIVELLQAFHAESSFRDVSFDREIIAQNMVKALALDSFCALVAETDGSIVGFLLGRCGRYFFSKEIAAWEEFIYVIPSARGTPAGRGLVRRFVAWAETRGVANVHLGINSGIDLHRAGLFFERLGFEKTGEAFVFKLKSTT